MSSFNIMTDMVNIMTDMIAEDRVYSIYYAKLIDRGKAVESDFGWIPVDKSVEVIWNSSRRVMPIELAVWSEIEHSYLYVGSAKWSEHYQSYLSENRAAYIQDERDYFQIEDAYWSERLQRYVLYDSDIIFERILQAIPKYHSSEKIIMDRSIAPEEDGGLRFGFELEIEFDVSKPEFLRQSFNKVLEYEFLHCERDSSLTFGFEIVSDIMDWEYFKKNEDRIYELLKFLNARVISTRTSGLHIHFSFDDYQALLVLQIVYKAFTNFYEDLGQEEIIYLFGRIPNSYCSILEFSNCLEDRHSALNLSELKKGIELRLFKSTTRPESFYAALDLVRQLVHYTQDVVEIARITDRKPSSIKGLNFTEYFSRRSESAKNQSILATIRYQGTFWGKEIRDDTGYTDVSQIWLGHQIS